MASTRAAAGFYFSVLALLAVAGCPCPGIASPLLPAESPVFDAPELSSLIAARPARLDIAGAETNAAETASADAWAQAQKQPRRVLADFALKLRNIAYTRGGRELATGFDCSGFVRYVFQQSLGLDLPQDSGSQFQAGNQVDRGALKMGDLVFFRTQGRRVSHVGIYLDNGLFIHSPSHGKRVRIDHLNETYWAKRFAGAKRPEALSS